MKEKIAILTWEKGLVPKGLMQLEKLIGNSTNPDSYNFGVKFVEIKGANTETVITHPSERILNRMIETSKTLEKEGIRAISTSCGFNAIFQKELSKEVPIPIFTSALLQIPFIQSTLGNQKIAVVTANGQALNSEHFLNCGVTNMNNLVIIGLEENSEWNRIFTSQQEEVDIVSVENEIIESIRATLRTTNDIGAILLECTDLPPFAEKIRTTFGLPVFDFQTMIKLIASSILK